MHGVYSIDNVHQSAYFSEAKESADVPFCHHEILECDSNGLKYNNEKHAIILKIPKGAVPDNKKIHFEVGVTMYGPFNFPKNTQPISPILWLCILEEDVELKKPIQIFLPHFLSGLTPDKLLLDHHASFAKADHNHTVYQNDGQMCYSFLPCEMKSRFVSRECKGYGVLSSYHCCFYCISAKKTPELAIDARYYLVRIEATLTPYRNEIIFSVIYFLDTCLRVSEMLAT